MLYKILLFFCLYLPFQLALNPAEGIDLASGRAVILFLFLFWVVWGLKNKKIIIAPRIQTLLIISFLFLSAFSLMVSQNLEWSLRKLFFLLSIFPLYFIISGIEFSSGKIKKIIQCLVWGAGLAGLLGIFQFLIQFFLGIKKTFEFWAAVITPFLGDAFAQAVLENPSWLVNIGGQNFLRATAFFPDPHMFSFYLNMAFFLALGLCFTKFKNKKTYLFLAGIILLADLLTFSRGGYIGLLAGIIFSAWLFRKKLWMDYKKALKLKCHSGKFWSKSGKIYPESTRQKSESINFCKKPAIILAIVILLGLIIAIPNPIGKRLISSFDLNEGSNQGRIETWKNSIEVVKNNPVLGVGLGGYSLEIKPSANYREPIYSHNIYLDIAAETGILNSLIWAGIILAAVSSFLKKRKNADDLKYIYIAMAAGLTAFSVHSFFETALFSARVLPLVIILVALSASDYKNKVYLRSSPFGKGGECEQAQHLRDLKSVE